MYSQDQLEHMAGIKAIITGALMSYTNREEKKTDVSSIIELLRWLWEEIDDLTKMVEEK